MTKHKWTKRFIVATAAVALMTPFMAGAGISAPKQIREINKPVLDIDIAMIKLNDVARNGKVKARSFRELSPADKKKVNLVDFGSKNWWVGKVQSVGIDSPIYRISDSDAWLLHMKDEKGKDGALAWYFDEDGNAFVTKELIMFDDIGPGKVIRFTALKDKTTGKAVNIGSIDGIPAAVELNSNDTKQMRFRGGVTDAIKKDLRKKKKRKK